MPGRVGSSPSTPRTAPAQTSAKPASAPAPAAQGDSFSEGTIPKAEIATAADKFYEQLVNVSKATSKSEEGFERPSMRESIGGEAMDSILGKAKQELDALKEKDLTPAQFEEAVKKVQNQVKNDVMFEQTEASGFLSKILSILAKGKEKYRGG